MSEQNNKLAISGNSNGGYNPGVILNEQQIAEAQVWLKSVLGQKSGIGSIADGMALIMRAKDLNIPLSTAVEHVHIIQGKTGVDIHILKALCSRAGVTWECIEDYTPQYEYTDGTNVFLQTQLPSYCVVCKSIDEAEKATNVDKGIVGCYPLRYYVDAKGNRFNEFEVGTKWTICSNRFHMMKVNSEGGYGVVRVPATPIDYVAKYKFKRHQMIYGEKVVTTSIGSYSYSEAVSAEMFNKDTYKKYPKVMIKARAWTYGARDIASDVCIGLMETSELVQVTDSNTDIIDISNADEL